MSEQIVVFGFGPVGRTVTEQALRQGRQVRVAQRSQPQNLPLGASFHRCDVLDAAQVLAAVQGASQIVIAIGMAYLGEVWKRDWPKAMTHLVGAAEAVGARVVFVDNLYMYGPQTTPLHEDMPLTDHGLKPAARSHVTRIWQAASQAGRIRFTALRAPDFYGPDVGQSQLGDVALGAMGRGKSAMLILPPDVPHDMAYVPDIGRAVCTLLDAPDEDFGAVWHTPNAPTATPRQLLEIAARTLGRKLSLTTLPLDLLPVMGLVSPLMREIAEMRFQMRTPYRVDASKFALRFWSDATPFEVGVPATIRSFMPGFSKAA